MGCWPEKLRLNAQINYAKHCLSALVVLHSALVMVCVCAVYTCLDSNSVGC